MAADYFLFIAGCPPGTNIEVSDSMWEQLTNVSSNVEKPSDLLERLSDNAWEVSR